MDHKQIERLMAAMVRSGITRLALKEEGIEIELEREGGMATTEWESIAVPPPVRPLPAAAPRKEEVKEGGRYITSPIVGTFYASSSPDDPPFQKVGNTVEEESVVCIIEAMKVMNEVKAGIRGTIAEILIKNGEAVEFGTKLFRITG